MLVLRIMTISCLFNEPIITTVEWGQFPHVSIINFKFNSINIAKCLLNDPLMLVLQIYLLIFFFLLEQFPIHNHSARKFSVFFGWTLRAIKHDFLQVVKAAVWQLNADNDKEQWINIFISQAHSPLPFVSQFVRRVLSAWKVILLTFSLCDEGWHLWDLVSRKNRWKRR